MVLPGQRTPSVFDGCGESVYNKADHFEKENPNERLKIFNEKPIKLQPTGFKTLSTTTELSYQINETFKPMFSDWYGCEVTPVEGVGPNGRGGIMINFVFKAAAGSDDRRVFVPIADAKEKTSNSLADKMMAMNYMNRTKNKNMQLTPYGAEMLYDLFTPHLRARNNNNNGVSIKRPESFNQYIAETHEQVQNGFGLPYASTIYCTVGGLSVDRILDIVFGDKAEDGDKYIRAVIPMYPVGGVQPGMPSLKGNWVIDIETLKYNKYNEDLAKAGRLPMNGAISAITGTISEMRQRG